MSCEHAFYQESGTANSIMQNTGSDLVPTSVC